MPRANNKGEVFKRITAVGLIQDLTSGLVTDLTAAAAAGATIINVTSATGLAVGDLIRIGQEDQLEENVIQEVNSLALTLRIPLAYSHDAGAEVAERMRVTLGKATGAGVRVATEGDINPIDIAESFQPYTRILRGVNYLMEFAIRNWNLENFAASKGIPESEITGAGTTASPYALRLLSDELMTQRDVSMFAQGVDMAGTTYEIQCWAVEMDISDDQQLTSGEGTPIRFNGAGQTFQYSSPALPAGATP